MARAQRTPTAPQFCTPGSPTLVLLEAFASDFREAAAFYSGNLRSTMPSAAAAPKQPAAAAAAISLQQLQEFEFGGAWLEDESIRVPFAALGDEYAAKQGHWEGTHTEHRLRPRAG